MNKMVFYILGIGLLLFTAILLYTNVSNHKTNEVNSKLFRYDTLSCTKFNTKDLNYTFSENSIIQHDSSGNLYVLDTKKMNIKIFDKDFKYIRSISRAGQGPGEFIRPNYFCFDNEENLYVSDQAQTKIIVFDREGRYSKEIKVNGTYGEIRFIVDANKSIYVNTPSSNYLVTVYDQYGKKKNEFGEQIQSNISYKKGFINQVTLAVDKEQNVWVAFHYAPVLRKYSNEGELLFEKRPMTNVIEEALKKEKSKGSSSGSVFCYFDDMIYSNEIIFVSNHYNIIKFNPKTGEQIDLLTTVVPDDLQKYDFIYKISYNKVSNQLYFCSQYDGSLYRVNAGI